MDTWKQHVELEITDAMGDHDRLLEMTEVLLGMHHAELMPQPVSDSLFNQIDITNEGS